MNLWTGMHKEGKIPVVVTVEYDEELNMCIVEVRYGEDSDFKQFEPKHKPVDGLMNIQDVEKAVKCANKILKRLKEIK